MNPESFIVDQVTKNLDADILQLQDISNETIKRYRKGMFDCLPSLIQEMRGKLSLIKGSTVKEYMAASGMSEYKARKHLNSLSDSQEIEVDTTSRPYVYKI